MKITGSRLGIAGEYRVVSELLLRGFNPSILSLDEGVDVILQSGQKIQVKTANQRLHKPKEENQYWAYDVNLKRGETKKGRLRSFVDFVICWCRQDNIFYVIPAKELRRIGKLTLGSNMNSKWNRYVNQWNLLQRG